LKVFPSNRPEDRENFKEIRGLSQPAMQNGATLYDIVELYSTNSVRELKKVFKKLKDRQEELQNQQMQQKQQELEQNQGISQAQLQQAKEEHDSQMAHDDEQKALDRESKEKIAIIQATGFGKVEAEDSNQNNIPDVLEASRLAHDQENAYRDYDLKIREIVTKSKESADKKELEKEKIKVEREKMANDLKIAKSKPKPKAKK